MNGLSIDTKDEMLAVFAGRVFNLTLFSGDEEITDSLYSRQEVQFSQPLGEGDVRYVQNLAVVRFEGFNSSHRVDYWGLVDLAGQLRARYRVLEPLDVGPTMDCKFRPGELRIGLP